jgi:hypothetical protein
LTYLLRPYLRILPMKPLHISHVSPQFIAGPVIGLGLCPLVHALQDM